MPEQHTVYFISMAARLLKMHPQTLRKYERLGLVRPSRTLGSVRVYSDDELERIRLIKHLVDEAGINLAGVQRLLSIAESVQRIRPLMREGRGPDARKRLARETVLASTAPASLRLVPAEAGKSGRRSSSFGNNSGCR